MKISVRILTFQVRITKVSTDQRLECIRYALRYRYPFDRMRLVNGADAAPCVMANDGLISNSAWAS